MQETWVQSRGREDPLEKRTATHSAILGILAWRIPWTEETCRLQLMGSQSPYWGYPGILWGVVLLNSLLTIVCVWFFLDDFLFFNGPSDLNSLKWNSGSESCCRVRLSATPGPVPHQSPLSVGILQARIPEWVATPFPRRSSQHRDQTHVSCMAGRFFTATPAGKPR